MVVLEDSLQELVLLAVLVVVELEEITTQQEPTELLTQAAVVEEVDSQL